MEIHIQGNVMRELVTMLKKDWGVRPARCCWPSHWQAFHTLVYRVGHPMTWRARYARPYWGVPNEYIEVNNKTK
jgi:hypothetical protein